jgi:hypothetical protein
MFNFHPQVPADKRKEVLEAISAWASVVNAALLKPDAKSQVTQRMAYATVKETADLQTLVKKIGALPEVESASLPASRKLL